MTQADDLGCPVRPGYNHWIARSIAPAACIPGAAAKGSIVEEPIPIEQGIAYGKHCCRGPKPPFDRELHLRKTARQGQAAEAAEQGNKSSKESREKILPVRYNVPVRS